MALPAVTRAQTPPRCSCATLVAAYPLRGSRAAASSTRPGASTDPHAGQRGWNRPAARSARSRGAGRTGPWTGQAYAPSPYTTIELASTSRPTSARAMPASRTAVPRSLQPTYSGRSATSTPMPTMAAWCTTASTPCSAFATVPASRTSPTTSGRSSEIAGATRCAAGCRQSSSSTSCPASTSASATCEPMNPAPPVTSTFMSNPLPGQFGRRGDHEGEPELGGQPTPPGGRRQQRGQRQQPHRPGQVDPLDLTLGQVGNDGDQQREQRRGRQRQEPEIRPFPPGGRQRRQYRRPDPESQGRPVGGG